jgi:hypothetical protein
MGARVVWDHEVAGSIPVTPTIKLYIVILCGSGSVVERHLAKVNVASSNLVFRSIKKRVSVLNTDTLFFI